MNIGIMGGTFNPIHHGHMILSEFIREELSLDRIIFIPTGNPHKDRRQVLDGQIRKEMIDLAIESNKKFFLSTIEIDRNGISYTIDTLRELKSIYPKDQLYMIIGADSLLELHTWKDFERLISITSFIVCNRYGSENQEVIRRINDLNHRYGGNIIGIETPIIDISSTNIRQRVKKNLSIKYLVSESVEEYISKNKLYK